MVFGGRDRYNAWSFSIKYCNKTKRKTQSRIHSSCCTGDYSCDKCEKVRVTGKNLKKKYHRYTGYIGNLKTMTLEKLLKEHPERVIQFAVKGMLPRNSLGEKCSLTKNIFWPRA